MACGLRTRSLAHADPQYSFGSADWIEKLLKRTDADRVPYISLARMLFLIAAKRHRKALINKDTVIPRYYRDVSF